jgi:protein tyrosine/serine phosphatase
MVMSSIGKSRSRFWTLAGLLCAVTNMAAGATQPGQPERPQAWARPITGVEGLSNFYQVTPTLYRSAQPSKGGLAYLSSQKPPVPGSGPIRTVLSLRAFHDDASIVPAAPPLRYEQIRFNTWHPENEDIVKFLRVATTPELQPVLVHCQHGSDRTGTMVALYRIVVQGWSKEAALLEMTQGGYGFHPLWQNLTRYVMQLDVESLKAELAKQGPWR